MVLAPLQQFVYKLHFDFHFLYLAGDLAEKEILHLRLSQKSRCHWVFRVCCLLYSVLYVCLDHWHGFHLQFLKKLVELCLLEEKEVADLERDRHQGHHLRIQRFGLSWRAEAGPIVGRAVEEGVSHCRQRWREKERQKGQNWTDFHSSQYHGKGHDRLCELFC